MNEKKIVTKKVFELENDNAPFGKRWGGETISITNEDIKQLQEGNLLALDVMSEYVVFLELKKNNYYDRLR